jgi:hypothetical protein
MSKLLPEEGMLTLDDACWHILEGWHLRTNAAERLADYHRLFLALLCRELGIEWHDDGAELRKAWESGFAPECWPRRADEFWPTCRPSTYGLPG